MSPCHTMVYTTMGKLAVYDDIFIAFFVSWYMLVIEPEKPAIRPLNM